MINICRNICLLLFLFGITSQAISQFEVYFHDKTMRLDYHHSGNFSEDRITFDRILEEPFWGGSHLNLVDTFGYGKYYLEVIAQVNDSLIYSHGYSTLLGEWQTTPEARQNWRTFRESVVFPYPKDSVKVKLYTRNFDGQFELRFEMVVDPADPYIVKERRLVYPYFEVLNQGDPSEKLDIVILPEGYTEGEMGKFIEDCDTFKNAILSFSPFKEQAGQINFWGILAPSAESGTDIPPDSIWEKTILNTSFYTFKSERYLMTRDFTSVRDLASNAPYDQIFILVNTDKYGGGGIYNYYNVSVMQNGQSGRIIIHEFGHGLASLADEYYTSSTGYDVYYNLEIEPYEANITTLVDFDSKWKAMIDKDTPIPTPDKEKYFNKVGVFEGGGYVEKGIYRPMHDCLMKSFAGDVFCPVCKSTLQQMIRFYSE
ncbi:MAG: M64 family metallopeptidase [bacterium]